MKIKVASVDSVIVYFSDVISKQASLEVKSAYKKLLELEDEGLLEIIPSYNSLFISYDIFKYDFDSIKTYLNEELKNLQEYKQEESHIITIDVYYGQEVGLDLEDVANKANITISELIDIHSSKIYDVYAIGFLPGFAYMAAIDEKIITPRLKTPRKVTPKGSVAIADNQTAVYPQNSPGGWNILGRTAFELFDKKLDKLSPISIDSRVKFKPISKEQFLDQGGVL